jgi:hypothetical protein
VCEKVLQPEESSTTCFITTIEPVIVPGEGTERTTEYRRHLRNLVICGDDWAKVERYLYADK